MRLRFFGTCAGTEPIIGMHHTSTGLELAAAGESPEDSAPKRALYWFDAGENCVYTAHTSGAPVMSTRAVFITHTHMDHVGGLANLFWTVRKLEWVYKRPCDWREISLVIPHLDTWDGVRAILRNSEGNFETDFDVSAAETREGVVYDDGALRVTAVRNNHLPEGSYSYLAEAEGKRVVFSGDVRDVDDCAELLRGGCDVLLAETGHHTVDAVCERAKKYDIGRLCFTHNGRDVFKDFEDAARRAESHGIPYKICRDGDVLEL